MMPLCGDMTGVAKGIAGLGALFYVAAKVWQSLARAEAIDVYPLLRPFALGLCILFFPTFVLGTINTVLSPVVKGCNQLMETQTFDMNEYREQKDRAGIRSSEMIYSIEKPFPFCPVPRFSLPSPKKSIMPISTIKARLPYDAATIWRIITSSDDYRWRSDIARIEKLSDKQFMEHTHSGYATLFTITISQPFERYEFDLENENIKGHWCGLLSERNGQTEIIFTETVFAKKWYLKPFVKHAI